jgi:heat shock protein HslJ
VQGRISRVIVSFGIAGSASFGAVVGAMLEAQGGVTKSIKGTVAYRERIALTPTAVLELTLEDVSKADAPAEKECLTGKRLAVAHEADNAAMERAYSEKRSKPGAEVLARVEGRIVSRPRMEGAGDQPTLIVEKFESITPGETCATPVAAATLENMYWKLLTLGDQPVVAGDKQREPHLLFVTKDSRIQGSTGCNRLIGSYVRKEASLTFKAAGTMMACPGLMTQERAFHQALNATASFKIISSNLELYGSEGCAPRTLRSGGAQVVGGLSCDERCLSYSSHSASSDLGRARRPGWSARGGIRTSRKSGWAASPLSPSFRIPHSAA